MLFPQETPFASNSQNVHYFQGDLEADNFSFGDNLASFSNQTIVISGNGNVDFGDGSYDFLDFSAFSIDRVVEFSLAEIDAGGEVFDVGDGERVFDRLVLENGSTVLFEGIDRLVFSDRIIDLTINPNDPDYLQQWNLHITGVQNAWRFTTGSEDVLVGVQDSGLGVDANNNLHPDIRATWFYDNGNGLFGNLADDFSNPNGSHGTSVQGIIAADADNGVGIAGINWNSDVYNIDVLDNNPGDLNLVEATQAMIDRADSQGQNLVVNLSIQVSGLFDNLAPFHANFETLVANNPDTLFVIAAGNHGTEGQEGLSSPGVLAKYYDNVIAVGAASGTTDSNGLATTPGERIDYSQYGEGLTLLAPSEVITTDANINEGFTSNSLFNGTSAAAPHVTGIASLVWSANNNLTAAEIQQILSETAYDLGQEGYDIFHGHGLINADAAVRRAIALGREDNGTGDIRSEIIERIRESLDSLEERFPNLDLEGIEDLFDLQSSLVAESSDSSSSIDPLTGSNGFNLDVLDYDNLTIDNFSATDSEPIDISLLVESGIYNLGVDSTDVFDNNALDAIASVHNNFWVGVQDNIIDNVNLWEEV